MVTTRSDCGRFLVIDALYLDRIALERLAKWAERRGLSLQDAIQIAVCAFDERLDDVAPTARAEGPAADVATRAE